MADYKAMTNFCYRSGYESFMRAADEDSDLPFYLDYIADGLPEREVVKVCKKVAQNSIRHVVFFMTNVPQIADLVWLTAVYQGSRDRCFILKDGTKTTDRDKFFGQFLPLINYCKDLHADLFKHGRDNNGDPLPLELPPAEDFFAGAEAGLANGEDESKKRLNDGR